MKARILAILETLFIALFCFSLYKVCDALIVYKTGQDDYESTRDSYIVEDEDGPYSSVGLDFDVDFTALKNINEEVYAWIYIPDSNIDYPVLWNKKTRYYERRTYDGKNLTCGSIFMEAACSYEYTDDNEIIHGHNMKDLSMFGTLRYYDDLDYLKEHPYIYIILEDRAIKYEIFSVHYTEIRTAVYTINFDTAEEKIAWAEDIANDSKVDVGIHDFYEDDQFITLSTCTSGSDDERLCIVGRKVAEGVKEY